MKRDLTQQLTDDERAVLANVLCGGHEPGIICRDCITLYTLRQLIDIRAAAIEEARREWANRWRPPTLRRGRKPRGLSEKGGDSSGIS